MHNGTAHNASVIAAVMVVAGFALILLGHRGGAGILFIPTQIAYAVSGGVAGVAMIGAGLAIANVQFTRLHTARRSAKLRALLADTVDVLTTLRNDPHTLARVRSRAGAADHGFGTSQERPHRPAAGQASPPSAPHAPDNNGQGQLDDHAPFRPPVTVLAGRTVFHQAGCRNLARLRDPEEVSVQDAGARGLAPCRVCHPTS